MRTLFTLLAACLTLCVSAQVVISELMQSNVDCLMDNLNEFPDSWVELHNTSSSDVMLSGYSIGESDDPAKAWKISSTKISAGGYVIIYCDKVASGLHTDFRLDSGKGGSVYLFLQGKTVDAVTSIPKQPAPNVSYSLCAEGSTASWAYVSTPTPGASNTASRALGTLPNVIFSLDGGVCRGSMVLELSMPSDVPAGTVIRYTKDGSEPNSSSPQYTQPIAIVRDIAIRAKLFCDGWISPRSTTRSYLFPGRKTTLPIVSIVTDEKYLTNSQLGILVTGNYSSSKKNYEYDWRRPMNIELYESDGTTCSINQLGEGRVMGAASRGQALKSLAIYAHKRFGTKRFDYEFFPDQRPGVTDYQSFLLRNAGNDFDYLYMRDAIIQRTIASHADVDWQAWRPAIFYLNGTYKGILNIRDRSNDDNIYTHYEGLEDIDMVKNGWELQHGTWDHYNAFKAFYNEHGHTWDEYSRWIDLDEYITVMAMNLYYNNFDFPGNNIVYWRPRTADGIWRIIVKDTDYTLGIYDGTNTYNMLQWINNADYDGAHSWANQWEHTRLFRRLMEDMDFHRAFLERSAIYMGDFMNERGTRATWDKMYDAIKEEYPVHRALYNRWWPNYDEELSKARKWLLGRTAVHYDHLASYYNLGTSTPLVINSLLPTQQLRGMRVTFNGVELSESSFNGKFYEGSTITLSARPATPDDAEAYERMKICAEGQLPADYTPSSTPYTVSGWRVKTLGSNGGTTTHEYSGPKLQLTMPKCACLQITAITEEASAIESIYADETASDAAAATIYDLQGRPSLGSRPAGVYLTTGADGSRRKVILR